MQVPETDSRIQVETVTFKGASGDVKAYLAKPAGVSKAPGVLIIHENKGLSAHIKDVARRAALDGFVALAPDFLSPVGGSPANEAEGPDKIKLLDAGKTKGDGLAALDYLRKRPDCNGKVGSVGFCWGGALSNQLAVSDPRLDAGVVFYGRSPEDADVAKIKAQMLLHYGSLDENINKTVPGYEAALKSQGKNYALHMYEGAGHAFHNDSDPSRHHANSAKLAWDRTVSFLKKTLAA
ncbi:MAG TPA: dienelactone hydrolase family protein [Alphaproteobacteria bacterium]|jgi:carboxymethylenebutenolidase